MTLYAFEIELSDAGRGVYQSVRLKVARHPSETIPYMLTRVLAYCLEVCDGLELSRGLAEPDEPALLARDLTGRITLWIEVGAPSAERLHRASKLVDRVVIYTYKNPGTVLAQFEGRHIQRAEHILLHALDPEFLEQIGALVAKRTVMTVSVSDGGLYVDIGGRHFSTHVRTFRLSGAL